MSVEFNGNHFFEFLLAPVDIELGHARKLHGMHTYFDEHSWCQSNTCNILNQFNFNFCVACCVGHLRCDNSNYNYLIQEGRHDFVNEKLWDGHAKKILGYAPSLDYIIVCKIYKVPYISCNLLCDDVLDDM